MIKHGSMHHRSPPRCLLIDGSTLLHIWLLDVSFSFIYLLGKSTAFKSLIFKLDGFGRPLYGFLKNKKRVLV